MLEGKDRKQYPIVRGVLDYFPDALLEVARTSLVSNEQHNPGEPLHWVKEKSMDEADALVRHLLQRGTYDTDGLRHSAKVAWRALALLQRELDAAQVSAATPTVEATPGCRCAGGRCSLAANTSTTKPTRPSQSDAE